MRSYMDVKLKQDCTSIIKLFTLRPATLVPWAEVPTNIVSDPRRKVDTYETNLVSYITLTSRNGSYVYIDRIIIENAALVKSRVVIFGSINLMAGPALLELHESDPFLFYFKVNFYSPFLQWRNSCLKVKPAWNVSRCTFHEPRRTLSKWVFILSHIVFFCWKEALGVKSHWKPQGLVIHY